MTFTKTLTRDEMKNIMAGSTGCRIFLRSTDGDAPMGYSPHCYTQADAESEYQAAQEGETWGEGVYVSGYCCDSCGEEGFPNAIPCAA